MQTSQTIDKISPAIVAAQAELSVIPKTARNPHFKSKYVPLPDLWEAVRETLAKHSLSVLQTFEDQQVGDGRVAAVHITSTLLHTSGQWIKGTLVLPIDKPTPQAVGSAITYGRRYSLESLLGVCGTEDDDAEGATTRNNGQAAKPNAAADPVAERIDDLI